MKIHTTLLSFSAVLLLATAVGFHTTETAEAYYQRSAAVTRDHYVIWEDPYHDFTGIVTVTHIADMTKGDTTVVSGDEIDFAYDATLFYTAGDGWWDTPYGAWCGAIDTRCMSIYSGQQVNNQASQVGYVLWTGVKPVVGPSDVHISSSNSSVVQCTGVDCQAVGPGSAKLTAHAPQTHLRYWLLLCESGYTSGSTCSWASEPTKYTGMPRLLYGDKINKIWMPARTIGSWNITVSSPTPPPSYSCTGSKPVGATICTNDETGLTGDVSWQQVASCTSARKCEYTMPAPPPPTKPTCPFTATNPGDVVVTTNNGFSSPNAEFTKSVTISAGTYTVDTMSWDGYTSRDTQNQPHEYWFIDVMNGATTMSTVGPTTDLQDLVVEDTKYDSFGPTTFTSDADTIRFYKDGNDGSVYPICAKFTQDAPPTPTVSLTANPTTIPSGGSANLTWTSTNATKCIATGGWSGDRITGDTESVSPSSDTTYYIRCINESTGVSSVTRHATVNVLEPLSVSLSNNRGTTANIGEDVTWTAAITGGQTPYSNYSWSGDTSATPSNFSNGSKVTEYYTTLGRKDVTFSVEDSTGTEVSDSDFIDIEDNRKLQ